MSIRMTMKYDMDECDICHCWDLCIMIEDSSGGIDAYCSFECIKKLHTIEQMPLPILAYTHPEST